MNQPNQFLSDVSYYVSRVKPGEPETIKDECFVDLMTEKYSLPEDSEASLCVAIQFIRSIAVLIE